MDFDKVVREIAKLAGELKVLLDELNEHKEDERFKTTLAAKIDRYTELNDQYTRHICEVRRILWEHI